MTTYQLTSNASPDDLSKLVDDAVRDGEVMLTRNGQIVAKIVSLTMPDATPTAPGRKRVIGTAKGLITVPPDFNEPLEDMRPYMEGPTNEGSA